MLEQLLKTGITGAPQVIEWAAVALGIFLATFLGRINIQRGRAIPPGRDVEISGALIDKTMAIAIIAALDRHVAEGAKSASALRATIRAIEMLSSRLENNTDASKAVSAMIDEARQDIRELTRELVRSKQ